MLKALIIILPTQINNNYEEDRIYSDINIYHAAKRIFSDAS